MDNLKLLYIGIYPVFIFEYNVIFIHDTPYK